jgi:Rap1a immunity proteins
MRTMLMIGACLMSLMAPAAAEEDMNSANYIMPACRGALGVPAGTFMQGLCFGEISALMAISWVIEDPFKFCPSFSVTSEQGVRVVVTYIDAIPHRHHEPFVTLALEGLRKAWPCSPR